MTPKRFNWKVFFVLWGASVLSVIALIPYVLTLQQPQLANLPIPLTVLIPIQIAQNAIIFAVVVAAGMFFAYRSGLGAPILEGYCAGEKISGRLKAIIAPSIMLGVVGSLIVVALDVFVFAPALKAELGALADTLSAPNANPPAWQGFLASFYGGIAEEVQLRWLVLSLFAFLGKFIHHTAAGRPTVTVLWMANILAAVLFGLGHLPATSLLIPLTPLVITRAIVLNGLVGLATGYLYFTKGLESAMLAHFSADIVLHVILAL
jgi:hypothetical protein